VKGARALVVLAMLAGLAGCSIFQPPAPTGLRTFPRTTEVDGNPVACPAFALVDPVDGILRGDPNDPLEPIWIEDAAGRRLSVVWPEGFTVTFEPDAILRDETGTVVAQENGPVELSQVRPDEHRGTFEDPYIASGLLFHGCYAYLP
jgi:hypothetical protein